MTSARTALIEVLREKKWSVGFAESCTGGLLSATITGLAGVSDVFMGSIVSYANDVKVDVLGVRAETLRAFGAVSEETALEMARGALRVLRSTTAVAITGIAGPSGGSDEKPVGMVWFAAAGPGFEETSLQRFAGDRTEIQRRSAEFAMEFLRERILRS